MERGTVEIRWLETGRVAEGGWTRLERLLGEEERQRAGRFRFDHDRHAYIAGHALVRAMLSDHAPVAPAAWRFASGTHGKPEPLTPPGAPRLKANLSHARGLAAVAVTVEDEVGIDVEWLERGSLTMKLARRFYAPAEVEMLAALPEERLAEGLFAIWTLKEAYIKAVGLGLALPLKSFAFTLDPLGLAFADGGTEGWSFRRFRPTPVHAMALALRYGGPVSVTACSADLDALLRLADDAAS